MQATRIYTVTERATGAQRLIRAANASQAMRCVAGDAFKVLPSTQDELVNMLQAGKEITIATRAAHPDQMDIDDAAQP